MKKTNLRFFCSGVLTTVMLFGCISAALAASASGNVSFNSVNLSMAGEAIFSKRQNLELASGEEVPSSIVYTDSTGGGTTYLPLAYIAQLLDVPVSWHAPTGTVVINGGNVVVDTDVFLQDLAEKWLVDGDYPRNSKGETYGPESLDEIVGHKPDLIGAVATNGEHGYLRQSEVEAYRAACSLPVDIEALIALSPNGEPHTLPVYDSEGNVIGEFKFENGDLPSAEELQHAIDYGNSTD